MGKLDESNLQAEVPTNHLEYEVSQACDRSISSIIPPEEEKAEAMDFQRKIIGDLLVRLERHTIGDMLALLDCDNASDRRQLSKHWELKCTHLLTQCAAAPEEDEINESEAIKEMEEWKRIQEERIMSSILPIQNLQQDESGAEGGLAANTIGGKRLFARIASEDPSLRITMKRVATTSTNLTDQIKHEAEIERIVIEERLSLAVGIGPIMKTVLKKDLASMEAILHSTKASCEEEEQCQDRVYFELSCQQCKGHHMKFVGSAKNEQDLKAIIKRLFDQVANIVRKKKAKKSGSLDSVSSNTTVATSPSVIPREESRSTIFAVHLWQSWSANFAVHFAQHFKSPKNMLGMKKTLSEKRIIEICQEIVKIEVLRRQTGLGLYWERVQMGV